MSIPSPEIETIYSATEISESLTGYDEVGIGQAFGPLETLEGNMPARALMFVVFKREGMSHAEAKDAAMSMSARTLADKFSDEDDVMPDEPDSEAGKGVRPLAGLPRSSPLSS